jgi:hypothetical protein
MPGKTWRRCNGPFVFMAKVDAAFGEVVRRHLQSDTVASQDTNTVFPYLTGRIGSDGCAIIERDPEGGVRQDFVHHALKLDHFLFGHPALYDFKIDGGDFAVLSAFEIETDFLVFAQRAYPGTFNS